MRFAPARLFAITAFMLVTPLGTTALAGPANDTVKAGQQTEANAEPATGEPDKNTAAKTEETASEDKRVCRYVKLETSSRRKTKVCRTVEEWRELNNIR